MTTTTLVHVGTVKVPFEVSIDPSHPMAQVFLDKSEAAQEHILAVLVHQMLARNDCLTDLLTEANARADGSPNWCLVEVTL